LAAEHPDWILGYQDEVWFSRLAQPHLHAWTAGEPLRLMAKEAAKDDADPKAIAYYGVLRADNQQMLLRFVDGRPVSPVTTQFLEWLVARMAQEGKSVLMLIWDNARWHTSREVRAWIKSHNRTVKAQGGCRLLACRLPSKSPWLNNIEPKWVHGKRKTAEPDRKLSAQEIMQRLCD
jgi:hypothetical protein